MQGSALSVDEFASLVAAALQVELDVDNSYAKRGIHIGGNSRLTDYHGRHPELEERPPPTLTRKHIKRPSLFNWRFRKSKHRKLSDSICTCGPSSFTTEEPYTEYDAKSKFASATSTSSGNTLYPFEAGMIAFASDPSPTVLAASMSSVDLGANCLGLVAGGGCGCGSSSGLRSSSPGLTMRTTRNLNGNGSGVAVAVSPPVPILTFEPDTDADRSPYVALDANVIDLSSTLQLPRTPSPSPQLQEPISPPPPPPRTPRKSFLAKLRSLSSKGSNNSSSNSNSPHISTPPMPSLSPSSPNAHIDTNNRIPRVSPTRLFSLHLPFPLTPISLSKPTSPNHSRSPSPKPPVSTSALSKRESAPVLSASYASGGGVLPTNQGSPICSANSGQDMKIGDKRRIQSLHACAPAPRPPTGRKEPSEQAIVDEEKGDTESMLSLADCLEGKMGSGERQNKTRDCSARGGISRDEERQETQNTQPFPGKEPLSSPELDAVTSGPSNYSCESAPRTAHGDTRPRSMKHSTKRSTGEKEVTFSVGTSLDPPISQAGAHCSAEPEEQPTEGQIFAPFVPLVLQHERLQQKLKKSVPLSSFEGAGEVEGVGIKAVAVGFPPRSTSLSSASIQIRQRTKSAPSAPLSLPLTKSKLKDKDKIKAGVPPVPSLPAHIASASATTPTTLRYQPHQQMQESNKTQELKRPTTAPASSMPNLLKGSPAWAVPFPIVKEAEAKVDGDKFADAPRQRKASKLFEKMRARKSLPPPLQPSGPAPASVSVVNLNEPGGSNPTFSGKGNVGLGYSLSMSKHPYANANAQSHSEGMLEDERTGKMVKKRLRSSVSFLPSSSDSHKVVGRQASTSSPSRAQMHMQVPQALTPSSPTPSNSGSGSEASTKSPVTPRSPFWGIGAGVSAGAGSSGVIPIGGVNIRTGMGLGIRSSSPVQSGEEGSGNELGKRSEVDGSPCIDGKKNYQVQPYSQPYTQTNVHFIVPPQVEILATTNTSDAVGNFEQAVPPSRAFASSAPFVKRRSSKQTMQNGSAVGAVPTKPPPVGPLPLPPSNDKDSGSETDKLGAKKITQMLSVGVENEIPESPVPSEYLKAFSVPPTPNLDDVEDETASMSHPYGCHKNSSSDVRSQSSESYEHDPEYEALLAANTMANVGVLASMRNIGVGRKLMSAHHEPWSEGLSPSESQRKRAGSEATRSPLVGTEWTLFLGNDDTQSPSGSKDVVGIKSFNGVRARTKSESALNTFAFGDKRPGRIKRTRSSTTAGLPHMASGRSSPPPPVPKLPKKRHVEKSEDWTLSLPLLPPEKNENLGSNMTKSNDTTRISGPHFTAASTTTLAIPCNNSIARSSSKRTTLPQPEVVFCVEGVVVEADDGLDADLDEADEITVAGSPVDDAFEIDLDSLGLDDEDDSEPESSVEMSGAGGLPIDPLLFSVPRVVSKGSGMECATWGDEEIKDSIRKKGRRLSDGLESVMGMAGVSIRLTVNADGESICVMDEQTENAEGEEVSGESLEEPPMTDAMKENLAKLDALSADLKRLNNLLKQGVGANRIDLKHARSCVLPRSQTDVGHFQVDPPIRVQQSVDVLRSQGSNHPILIKSGTGVNVKEKVKSWTERSASLSGPSHIASSSNASNPASTKIRPPLPFAPSSAPGFHARSLSRNTGLSARPSTTQGVDGQRAAPGRSMSLSMDTTTKSSLPSTTTSIASTIPVGVVGSGLKVGGNGRVISLSTTSSTTSMIPAGNTQPGLKIITSSTETKTAIVLVQGKEIEDITTVSKRDSASSSTSTDTFFTSFSSSSPAPTPPLDRTALSRIHVSSTSGRRSGSESSTPTGTILPCLTIITSPSVPSSENHSPANDMHTPSSSAMPTPLASSFPFPPPLPDSFTSLGEDLNTVSKILAVTRSTEHQTASSTTEYSVSFFRPPRPVNPDASRLSSASEVSVHTIVPGIEHRTKPHEDDRPSTLVSEVEMDTESTYSGSFYSARSSFDI